MHNCKALFVTCMDFRLQSAYPDFAKEKGLTDNYDLFSHWDCGAYGGNSAFADDEDQRKTYCDDMQKAKEIINGKLPEISVHKYLVNWDNENKVIFEKIS